MSKATKLYEEYIDNLVYVAAYNVDNEQGLAQRACPNISNKELKR